MVVSEIHTQLVFKPPIPIANFSGKTVTVTGANVGLGKEVVKHFACLCAAKVIATARSAAKDPAALAEIESFWDLDYSSYAFIKAFCARVANLERLEAVVLNAGVGTRTFEIFEQGESLCRSVKIRK